MYTLMKNQSQYIFQSIYCPILLSKTPVIVECPENDNYRLQEAFKKVMDAYLGRIEGKPTPAIVDNGRSLITGVLN